MVRAFLFLSISEFIRMMYCVNRKMVPGTSLADEYFYDLTKNLKLAAPV